ncbi:MAG: peptidase T [Eubacterium sp.]|nr:peptidase T [Eubacterium sp.]
MTEVIERFLRYVKVDTQSLPDMETVPSTEKQKDLGKILAAELKEIGLMDVKMDEHGYVYGTLAATEGKEALPVLGLIAHMDTSSAVSGKDVKPRIVENYQGGDIVLNAEKDIVLSVSDFPEIENYIGQSIIVTDGTTLLGADDKAGIAEIMALCSWLVESKTPHGTIKIAFTPDEEVGKGPEFFDVADFGADFAYTVDGGEIGELEYENFNGATFKLKVNGVSTHTGTAKNKMKNASVLAMEFHRMLPAWETPEHTEGYEGFYHLDHFSGDVEEANLTYLIRDHDRAIFEARKSRVAAIVDYLNGLYGEGTFEYSLKDAYFNMKEQILPHMHLIDNAKAAMAEAGITPIVTPIRGGTDGARLSFMGLPCPNLCTGGHNYHGRFEYIPVESMEKILEMLKALVKIYA